MLAPKENLPSGPIFERILSSATGITADSRLIQPGNVFVALKGFQSNGNYYIGEAIRRGASAIVTEHPLDIHPAIPVFVVTNARRTLAYLCAWYYGFPGNQLKITAVTGTNGKTTTAAMIDTILNVAGYTTGFIGTDRIKIATTSFASSLTTPDAPTLQKCLHDMVQQKVTHVTMETSAQGIELERVTATPFQCGIMTNISMDHLDFYESFDAYVSAKGRFLDILSNGHPLCVNADDPLCTEISRKYPGTVITYGVHNPADIMATHISLLTSGCSFRMRAVTPALSFDCACLLKVCGLHNIYNALAAASACITHQILPDTIIYGLARFKGVERRMQIRQLRDFTIVDDTALNPGSIDAVFQAINQFSFNRIVLVTSIRGSRGTAINCENAERFVKWSSCYNLERVIVTSSHSHIASRDYVTAEEEAAFLKTLSQANLPFAHFRELPDAIGFALTQLKTGDLLLLLGAQGMDPGGSILDSFLSDEESLAIPIDGKNTEQVKTI